MKKNVPPAKTPTPAPNPAFTQALAREIVKNLVAIGQFTARPFNRERDTGAVEVKPPELGVDPMLVDTSILIDGRILPIVNSGFLTGTLIIPQFVLGEVQHIADSDDALRRAKGRRGLDIVGKLKWQRANPLLRVKIVEDDMPDIKEVDHKLVALARKWHSLPNGKHIRLLTVDFNLAHLARAQGVAVLSVHDMAQALKLSLVVGEELTIKIAHAGKEREQGVGYLPDGTMIVVDNAKDKVGADIAVIVTKIHQTPAGQLFFARLK
ncbi:MAG: hypothetical protein EHM28_12000, partial [Spirochaetaceae bacterium]